MPPVDMCQTLPSPTPLERYMSCIVILIMSLADDAKKFLLCDMIVISMGVIENKINAWFLLSAL